MRDTFRETRSVLAAIGASVSESASSAPRGRATNAEINAAIDAFVRVYVRSDAWEIVVPGNHSGGVSYQQLFAFQAAQGRDFLQSTVQLYQAVRIALAREFVGGGVVPSTDQQKKVAAVALLDHVELRLSKRGNADIKVTPLSAAYAAWKRRMGRGSYPIGVNTGETRAAFSRKAMLRWLK